jgi:hypothetical protein
MKEVVLMLDTIEITLAVVVGMLLAVIFALRILVIMERRVARMELHIERLATSILKEEHTIEKGILKPKKK